MQPLSQLNQLSRQALVPLRSLLAHSPRLKAAVLKLPGSAVLTHIVRGPSLSRVYYDWTLRSDTVDVGSRELIVQQISRMTVKPRIAVVMPVYDPPADFLRACIESVRSQLWQEWQLCIADDASPSPHVTQVLEEYKHDRRVQVIRREQNGHISAATNSALELVEADWVALLDHDDLLPEHALYRVALEILSHPAAQVIYSDEDKIDGDGRRGSPYLKPDFDPDLLLGHNMVSHLGVYRRDLLDQLGGLRIGFEGSQDYDLALRAVAAVGPRKVRHIPNVLYHWRQQSGIQESFSEGSHSRCVSVARLAIKEHLIERGRVGASVESAPGFPDWTRVVWNVPSPAPLVSIVLLIEEDQVYEAVKDLRGTTDYTSIEVLVPLSHSPTSAPSEKVTLISAIEANCWSSRVNQAVAKASGEIIVILARDTMPLERGWLRELVSQSLREEIGIVGGKIISTDGRIIHAGFVLGEGGVASPIYHGSSCDDHGYMGALSLVRRVSAVGATCFALRRELFETMGGLNEDESADLADIDLCLRLNASGYDTLYTPFATMIQRGPVVHGSFEERYPKAVKALRRSWGETLDRDPWLNPWLTLKGGHPTFRTAGQGPIATMLADPPIQPKMDQEPVGFP